MDSLYLNSGEMRKLILILLLFPLYAESQIIGKFNCDGNVTDAIGVNNLTATGTPTYAQGIRGQCIVLSGSQYATKTSPTGFPSGDANISVGLWINTNSATGVQTMCAYGGYSGTRTAFGPTHYWNSNTSADIEFYGADCYAAANTLSLNKWHYVVYTHTGGGGNVSASVKIYVDGVLVPIVTTNSDGTLNLSTTQLVLGNFTGTPGAYPYSGSLDEVTWYSNVLTPAQVKNNYGFYTGKSFF